MYMYMAMYDNTDETLALKEAMIIEMMRITF